MKTSFPIRLGVCADIFGVAIISAVLYAVLV